MSLSRPASRALRSIPASRNFSASSRRLGGSAPAEPPTGWLFGVPPGEKRKKEAWEPLMYYGFFGGIGLTIIASWFRPDTSIQTWALEEARRRLEAEGILPDPDAEK